MLRVAWMAPRKGRIMVQAVRNPAAAPTTNAARVPWTLYAAFIPGARAFSYA